MTDLKTAMTVEVDGLQACLIFSPLASKEIPCMIRTILKNSYQLLAVMFCLGKL